MSNTNILENASSKLLAYTEEVKNDLKINDMNLEDKSFNIPQKKHYWATKLILEKQKLIQLERDKKKVEIKVSEALNETMPIKPSERLSKSKINSTPTMINLAQEIEDQKLLVEYLEKVEKIFAFITNDLKNIIEVKQMDLNM